MRHDPLASPRASNGDTTYDGILSALRSASAGDLAARAEVDAAADAEDSTVQLALAVNILLHDLQQRDAERLRAEASLRSVLDQLPIGVQVAEVPTGRLFYENAEAAHVLGHQASPVDSSEGFAALGAVHDDGSPYAPAEYPLARAAAFGERTHDTLMSYLRPDGVTARILVNAAPVVGSDDRVVAAVATFRDITPLHRAEQALREAYDEVEGHVRERTSALKRANSELDAFNAMVAHDLRAPVRAIGHLIGVVREDAGAALAPSALADLDRIHASVKRMDRIIADLLDFSRSAKGSVDVADVDLAVIAKDALDVLLSANPERHVEWRIGNGLTARADPRLARIIMDNLLSNALKFTRGKEDARIEFDQIATNGGMRTFRVRDNGLGFDPEMAPRLFQPFQRLKEHAHVEGTGVGLATVSRIVERHGGHAWAESAPGHGASFLFTLPAG